MNGTLAQWVADYGYWAVALGSLLEGESVLLLAGLAAHQGALSFPIVVLIAFCGGTLGDQLLFQLGRRHGTAILRRVPAWEAKAAPVKLMIRRHQDALIVGVRFMYGLRLVGPVAIGMSEVSTLRFALLNMFGAAIWAPLIAWIGYAFGQTLAWLIADLGSYERWALVALAGALALAWLTRKRWRGSARHAE